MKGSSCVRRLRARSFWCFFWFSLFLPWCSALCVSLCVRSIMRLWNPWLQIALEWLHDCCMGLVLGRCLRVAAWMLHGACVGVEAGAQNLVFFPCKVAAGGDEGQLVCEAVAGTLVVESLVADRNVMAAWMLHGACVGEEAGARNLVFFRVK